MKTKDFTPFTVEPAHNGIIIRGCVPQHQVVDKDDLYVFTDMDNLYVFLNEQIVSEPEK